MRLNTIVDEANKNLSGSFTTKAVKLGLVGNPLVEDSEIFGLQIHMDGAFKHFFHVDRSVFTVDNLTLIGSAAALFYSKGFADGVADQLWRVKTALGIQ